MGLLVVALFGNRTAACVLLFLQCYGEGHAQRQRKRLEQQGVLVSRRLGNMRLFNFKERNPTVRNLRKLLEAAGILATVSGGAAVSLYTNHRYQSEDLDFVSSAAAGKLAKAVETLGFVPTGSQRLFAHPQTPWLLEFPASPLGFGETIVNAGGVEAIETVVGPLRVITPTPCVMDRLAAFVHWNDRQCYDKAIWVAQSQAIDWEELEGWVASGWMSEEKWLVFYQTANRPHQILRITDAVGCVLSQPLAGQLSVPPCWKGGISTRKAP
jgi:hypothetical protein